MLERIQKIISAAGVTSRRAAETLITEGRVSLNGKVVTELGSKADASKDHIKVDGKLINPKQPPTYIMLNKPAGFITSMSDPEGRPTVQNLLKGVKTRVYPVGRLDYNTEGLLLMTNDGDFAHLITHPKHEFPKTYLAKVKGVLDDNMIDLLEKGVFLADGKTAPAKLKKIRKEEANSWVEITIHEGRKRQVRRMFDHVGRSVIRLKRIKTGSLTLGDLPEGTFRHLSSDEVRALRETSEKTELGIQKPVSRSRKPEERNADQKTAHKGRTLDLRPGRAVWSDEKKQGTGARGRDSGARGRDAGARVQGPGSRSSASRPAAKTAWRGSSSGVGAKGPRYGGRDAGSRGQSTGARSSAPRPAAKSEWRGPSSGAGGAKGPGARGQGSGYRSSAPRPAAKTEWRGSSSGPGYGGRDSGTRGQGSGSRSSAPRPAAKTEWRGSSSGPEYGGRDSGTRGQGTGSRSSAPRPAAKTEWRGSSSGPGYGGRDSGTRGQGSGSRSSAPRPAAKTDWRGSSSAARSQGAGSSKPRTGMKTTGRKPLPKTMLRVERSPGPKKSTRTQGPNKK